MQQFLSNMMTGLITRTTRKRGHICAVIMTALAFSLIAAGYLAKDNLSVDVIRRLLIGFAPLIGLFALLAFVTFLYTILLCSAERIFTCDDENAVPERSRKNKWHIVRGNISSPQRTHYLSLKEHSPPSLQATPASAN